MGNKMKTKLGIKVDIEKINQDKEDKRVNIGERFVCTLNPDFILIEDYQILEDEEEMGGKNFIHGYHYGEDLSLDEIPNLSDAEKEEIYSLIIEFLGDER